jgi:membrane protease YdiL (CAAX protease family)
LIWVYATLLVVWGNVLNYFVQPMLPGGDWAAVAWGAALVVLALAFARLTRQRRGDLGLARGDLRGVAIAAALALVAATVGTVVLRVGPIVGAPIEYHPLFSTTPEELAAHVVLFLPLAAVIPEELAFRGVLLGGLLRARSLRAAVVASSVAFALWHGFVVYVTLLQTSLAGTSLAWLAGAAALLFVAAGGAVLALLRVRSRGLAAPIVAHWAFDAALLVGLWV